MILVGYSVFRLRSRVVVAFVFKGRRWVWIFVVGLISGFFRFLRN